MTDEELLNIVQRHLTISLETEYKGPLGLGLKYLTVQLLIDGAVISECSEKI